MNTEIGNSNENPHEERPIPCPVHSNPAFQTQHHAVSIESNEPGNKKVMKIILITILIILSIPLMIIAFVIIGVVGFPIFVIISSILSIFFVLITGIVFWILKILLIAAICVFLFILVREIWKKYWESA